MKTSKESTDIAMLYIKELVNYLNPIPTIYEFNKELEFEFAEETSTDDGEIYVSSPHKTIRFQVKSCEYIVEEHKATSPTFWCSEINLDVLISLAKFVGADLQDYLLKALDILELLKPTAEKSPIGDWLDYRRVRRFLTNQQWNALFELKVVNLIGGKVFYL